MAIEQVTELGSRSIRRIGLGTNRLTDDADNRAFLRAAVDVGLNLVDTAHLYSSGDSERAIGAALAPFPNELVVATKGAYSRGGGKPERLRAEIEQSFESLRTETIALYFLHRIDPETPIEDSLGVLKEYRDAGRIEHVGLSEVTVDDVKRGRGVVPIAAVQNEYNLSRREHDKVIDFCEAEGILFVPFFPLRGKAAALEEIAARYEATPHQIALAWLLKRSPAVAPIPGTLSLEHLKTNLAALEIELEDADYTRLADAA